MQYRNPIPKLIKRPNRSWAILRLILMWLKMYFTTQGKADESEAVVIETDLDDRIEPDEQGIYPYLFACVYILFAAWTVYDSLTGALYRRTRQAFATMIKRSQEVFAERPTRMRNRQRTQHPLVLFTQRVDGPTNCYPSLHVGLVVLSYQIIKNTLDHDDLLRRAMRQSCIEICRSTLSTKQHSIIDVIGGTALAKVIYLEYFDGPFEDLLDEIVPELSSSELASIRAVSNDTVDLVQLLDDLLALFRKLTKSSG